MMDDRYFGPEDQFQVSEPQRRSDHYSSARDYEAAGVIGRGYRQPQRRDFPSQRSDASSQRSDYAPPRYRDEPARSGYGRDDRDRDFFERAGDEVRSWFGDEEAERRRERDQRYDAARAHSTEDSHYHNWRRDRIAELDRDYDEYRRENAQRFHNEFSSWRSDRQGQRNSLGQVAEHMEVLGSDGEHLGTVDKVRGDRILLTKSDPAAGGHHHSIPSRWIDTVDGKVTLRKTAAEARSAWKEEEGHGAFFGGCDQEDDRGPHILNRSFSGTY
jgi:hypothetical protein